MPTEISTANCPECTRLQDATQDALRQLVRLTSSQLEAFQAGDNGRFARLDKEVEQVMGAKERTIGAFHQHQKEHDNARR